eukprot:TRINITY_DN2564_c0_g1_i1.p1 TRINITY_DN2564_c0_g1~~TRINITY_DN2564_c0_g1_i1.p1  ORF type:complete len:297 (-),score=82.94 TRINITY_DN2564_c0_g1_i1:122-892(-)
MDEEERLARTLDKAFERKRKEALDKYKQEHGGANFELSGPVHKQVENKRESSGGTNWKAEQFLREQQERERAEAEAKQKAQSLETAQPSEDLRSWKEKQEQEEREFKKRLQEEERRKQQEIERLKQAAREEQEKRESELRKEEELKRAEIKHIQEVQHEQQLKQLNPQFCFTCGVDITDPTKVYVHKNNKYCHKCSLAAQAPKCAACGEPLGATVTKANNKRYHPDCLRCSKCGGTLDKGFRVNNNKFICAACVRF